MEAALAQFMALVIFLPILVVFWYFVAGKHLAITPINFFYGYQTAQLIGSVLLIEAVAESVHINRVAMVLVGNSALLFGAILLNQLTKFRPHIELSQRRRSPLVMDVDGVYYSGFVLPMAILGIIVGVLFANALGQNALQEIVELYSSTGDTKQTSGLYAALRTDLTRQFEAQYLAPGYTAQFTTVLLPMTFFLCYCRARILKDPLSKIIALTMLPLVIYFMTLTGVRNYIVIFAVSFLCLLTRVGPFRGRAPIRTRGLPMVIVIVAAAIFVLFTALGREGVASSRRDPGDRLLLAGSDLLNRIVFVNSGVQLEAIHYFQDKPPELGRRLLHSVVSIAPRGGIREFLLHHLGLEGTLTPSSELYQIIYGHPYGNAPPDIWTTAWIDFRWLGIIAVGILAGACLQYVSVLFARTPLTVTSGVCLCMLSFSVITVFDFSSLFLSGTVSILIFYAAAQAIKIMQRSRFGRSTLPGAKAMPVKPSRDLAQT